MENASKAIIMAGGILIGVIILATLVIVFRPMGDVYEGKDDALLIEQLEKYNRQFNTYDKSLYGSELLSLANLVYDFDNKFLYDIDPTGNYYKENKIVVTVKLDEETIGYNDVVPSYESLQKESKKKADGCDIELLRKYDKALENKLKEMEKTGIGKNDNDYQDVKASITQFRSIPFRCISSQTKYNKYGRISKMIFEQAK